LKTDLYIFFRKNPFVRLIIPLSLGIVFQWYLQFSSLISISLLVAGLLFLIIYNFFSLFQKYKLSMIYGLVMHLIMFSLGMLLMFTKDIRHRKSWFGKKYLPEMTIKAILEEHPIEKPKSYKAEAKITRMITQDSSFNVVGKIIIYFKKDSFDHQLKPGSQIIFNRPLQEIKNTGNPGAFDYKRYALFNEITHQVYLTPEDFRLLNVRNIVWFESFLFSTKDYVLNVFKKFIPGKKECGLAEALLIGYKDDLDKNLLQSYTNTGVVHIIAVSGMHLALIFLLLDFVFKPLLRHRRTKWLHPVLVISILWIFTFITGGAASIVRAAVMFTFVMIGKTLKRNASIYNILAASAFCLLLYNPFWLWDVGFQLSYTAVLSIVVFYKPLNNLIYFTNKSLAWLWSLLAVSIAAQILTTPLSVYHFHQFPVYFLLTNLFAVPVSSVILIGELILVIFSPIKFLAVFLGKILDGMIWWLNSFIERLEQFPFALWSGLQTNILQTISLYIFIAAIVVWLFQKMKPAFWIGFGALILFFGIRSYSFYETAHQRKLIVYNVPKFQAIDFINGRKYFFAGDLEIIEDPTLTNFYLRPSRIEQRIAPDNQLPGLKIYENQFIFDNKRIIIVDAPLARTDDATPAKIDLAILSGNPRLYISDLIKQITPAQIVIDSSVPAWKAGYWKKDCDSLQIPYFDVSEKGAFVMNF
jgi:competence protein ComEC